MTSRCRKFLPSPRVWHSSCYARSSGPHGISKVFRATLMTSIVALCTASDALACRIAWRPQDELENEAEAVVVARVTAVRHVAESFRGDDYEYEVSIESSERGGVRPGRAVVAYEDLKAHLRGQAWVCPIKNGSGIEAHLEPGQRYRLYLKRTDKLEILLARPR